MLDLVHMIVAFVAFLEASKYGLLFLGSYFEGSVAIMTGGLLLRLGHVDFWPMYLVLFAGDILSDLMWYCIGYFGARTFLLRYGKYFNITAPILEKVEGKFHQYHLRILVISKLTMGFGLATAILATAGMLRVSLLRYLAINILCGIVWIGFLVGIGYYFGNVLVSIPRNFQIGGTIVMVVVFFVIIRVSTVYLSKYEWN